MKTLIAILISIMICSPVGVQVRGGILIPVKTRIKPYNRKSRRSLDKMNRGYIIDWEIN